MQRMSRLIAAALCALLPCCAFAQAYPAKPVRIIVPSAPGGGLDVVGRIFSARLGEAWGQQAIIENRAGANFIVGTEAVAKAPPDGYTLLFTSHAALTINPVTFATLPYSPRDLAPIMMVYITASGLLANANLPATSVQELLALMRANPGKLNHASNSAATILASEQLKALAKVDYADINYKGGGLSAAAVASGETQFCIVDMGSATIHVKSGRARLLAVTTPQRSKLSPGTPTIAESGLPGYAYTGMTALLAPAKTPPEIIARVNADMKRVLSVPETIAKIEAVGGEVFASSPEEAGKILQEELERWSKLVKERNIRF